jgi:hypothetical protein
MSAAEIVDRLPRCFDDNLVDLQTWLSSLDSTWALHGETVDRVVAAGLLDPDAPTADQLRWVAQILGLPTGWSTPQRLADRITDWRTWAARGSAGMVRARAAELGHGDIVIRPNDTTAVVTTGDLLPDGLFDELPAKPGYETWTAGLGQAVSSAGGWQFSRSAGTAAFEAMLVLGVTPGAITGVGISAAPLVSSGDIPVSRLLFEARPGQTWRMGGIARCTDANLTLPMSVDIQFYNAAGASLSPNSATTVTIPDVDTPWSIDVVAPAGTVGVRGVVGISELSTTVRALRVESVYMHRRYTITPAAAPWQVAVLAPPEAYRTHEFEDSIAAWAALGVRVVFLPNNLTPFGLGVAGVGLDTPNVYLS